MLYSNLFTKTSKDVPADEVSKNAQLLIQAGFVHKTMAGVYSYLPLGLKVINKIENILRKHLNSIGGQEILMNSLHPKIWWEKTNRWEGVDILFKLESQTDTQYALACSHEEQVTPIVKNFVNSWKDLPQYNLEEKIFPLCVYQIQTKFRDELRAKSGMLRGREFRMKDMYDFHSTKQSQDKYYDLVKKTYLNIYTEMGLKAYPVQASGGIFTKNESHEFQVVCDAGEDEILYSEDDQFAINSEIYDTFINSGGKAPKNLKKAVSAEVGNIFKLDTKYTDPFEVSVTDKDNNKIIPLMNCHGIGTSRCMGVIAEIHSDERGLKWPKSVAPFGYHIITSFNDKDDQSVIENIQNTAQKLCSGEMEINGEKINSDVIWDDRKGVSLGEKLKDADLIGCPMQVIITKRSLENGGVEIKDRATLESKIVSMV